MTICKFPSETSMLIGSKHSSNGKGCVAGDDKGMALDP